MMKYNLYFLIIITFISCSKITPKCEITMTDFAVYSGYGVVKFSYSRTGGIRYLEFYPICVNNIENIDIENFTNTNFGEGIIIRENNSSNIWKTLITDKSIVKNDEEYGKALIYIEFNSKINKNKAVKKLKNHISIFNKGFNLVIVDIGLYNIETKKIEVLKGLK